MRKESTCNTVLHCTLLLLPLLEGEEDSVEEGKIPLFTKQKNKNSYQYYDDKEVEMGVYMDDKTTLCLVVLVAYPGFEGGSCWKDGKHAECTKNCLLNVLTESYVASILYSY